MNITFFTERPLSLAESMVRNSPLDNRRKFRVIVRAADATGRNVTVMDESLTVTDIAKARRAKPRRNVPTVVALGTPTTWTVVVAVDADILVRTVPFKPVKS